LSSISASFGLSASDWGDLMRKSTDCILMLRPWSLSTFMAALLAVAFATTVQELFAEFGARLCFAGFFPVILIASLVGGAPAGIFATLLTIPIVWWAFMPPYFEFNALTPADYDSLATFLLSSSLVVSFSQLYREALILRK
jgi:K+-sensing histidine kinase KdpD